MLKDMLTLPEALVAEIGATPRNNDLGKVQLSDFNRPPKHKVNYFLLIFTILIDSLNLISVK
jgi:hypothetical protein